MMMPLADVRQLPVGATTTRCYCRAMSSSAVHGDAADASDIVAAAADASDIVVAAAAADTAADDLLPLIIQMLQLVLLSMPMLLTTTAVKHVKWSLATPAQREMNRSAQSPRGQCLRRKQRRRRRRRRRRMSMAGKTERKQKSAAVAWQQQQHQQHLLLHA